MMAGFFDAPNSDPTAGIDPGTFDKVRSEWDAFLGNPQGRAALLSAGLALMQPPSFGDTGASQIGRAIGAAGASATYGQAQDLKAQEAASKQDLRSAQAEAKIAGAQTAEQRAATAEARLGTTGANLELRRQALEAGIEKNRLGNQVRLSGMYQNYVRDTSKRNESARLLNPNAPVEPILPITQWAQNNPMVRGLLPQNPDDNVEPDTGVPAASPATTSGPTSGALPMPATKDQLQAGRTYQTSRGPATWDGTKFRTP